MTSRVLRFLRYNSLHRLYFPGDGALPQLNPISSRSHAAKSRKRTRDIYEPRWFRRLRQRLFCAAGRQRCGRRDDLFSLNRNDGPLPDTWDRGPDGYRTCSYCGSIHPDDLMDICRKSLTDERYDVHMSDKSYKAYVRSPGVRNASEGAIKFYMQHVPDEPTAEDQELFAHALRLSSERFTARFKAREAPTALPAKDAP